MENKERKKNKRAIQKYGECDFLKRDAVMRQIRELYLFLKTEFLYKRVV